MQTRRLARTSLTALALIGAVSAPVWAQAPATALTNTAAIAEAAPAIPVPYSWRGQEASVEDYLRTADVVRWKDIPVGITKPRRGYFGPGGLATSFAWKALPPGLMHGKMESYKSEIAAYLLSRHLGMDVVPPVVERQIGQVKGAAVFWIEGVRPWDPAKPPKAAGARWSRQTSRMQMFDQLIANIDRNQGNLLYDAAGHLYLIDHSRAFTPQRHLSGLKGPQQYERALWTRIAALTREDVETAVGPWLTSLQVEALLSRRDEMAKQVERQVRERGEQVVFLPLAPEPPSGTAY